MAENEVNYQTRHIDHFPGEGKDLVGKRVRAYSTFDPYNWRDLLWAKEKMRELLFLCPRRVSWPQYVI